MKSDLKEGKGLLAHGSQLMSILVEKFKRQESGAADDAAPTAIRLPHCTSVSPGSQAETDLHPRW